MNHNKQVEIIEKQISNFETVLDKMQYISMAFKPDPSFSQDAIDEVISNICKTIELQPYQKEYINKG